MSLAMASRRDHQHLVRIGWCCVTQIVGQSLTGFIAKVLSWAFSEVGKSKEGAD
jgi:hypothetical protein